MPIQKWDQGQITPEKYRIIMEQVPALEGLDAVTITRWQFTPAFKAGTPIQIKEGRTIGGIHISANALGEIVEKVHEGYVIAFHIEGKRIAFTAGASEIAAVHHG